MEVSVRATRALAGLSRWAGQGTRRRSRRTQDSGGVMIRTQPYRRSQAAGEFSLFQGFAGEAIHFFDWGWVVEKPASSGPLARMSSRTTLALGTCSRVPERLSVVFLFLLLRIEDTTVILVSAHREHEYEETRRNVEAARRSRKK